MRSPFLLFTYLIVYPLMCSSKYIVKLKNEYKHVSTEYENIYIGDDFNVIIVEDDDKLEDIKNQGIIDFYEKDISVYTNEYQWGLDRIDQRKLPLNNKYLPKTNGKGTYVYILDTGVYKSHNEFEGRVQYGFSAFGGKSYDKHGHGTHVMSTVLGKTVGVANQAKGIAVKVLSDSGSGSVSGVIKGIEWSVNDIQNKKRCGLISMSLGGGKSTLLNDAVNSAVRAGVNVIVSGGNSNGDACRYSPASAEEVITVGSTTITDLRSSFSNYGKCTDIFAPGSDIVGASQLSKDGYRTLSGTSMACPHVAGATLLMLENNKCVQKGLKTKIQKEGTKNKIKNIPAGTLNIFLQVQNITPITSQPTQRPTKPKPTQSPTQCPTTTSIPTLSPIVDCTKNCNKVDTRCSCWYNHDIFREQNCKCAWKHKKKKCVARKSGNNEWKPQPEYPSCNEECADTPGKCACWTNKVRGGKCHCKWKPSTKQCIPK